CGQGTYWPYSF
nr:immunoglobulin light chain junction region [Macaca mulatta]MOX23570.1 immunoglobulin light chain junction region [Macaca mulatta]MOX23613.1 immunoglobulin light chain junction region [Macaca mulatta]MOX23675.1 immunoglobulin light chain junction region [Macaca mulatta]MOX23705.1 immunoglobulin light chain junction region [Macaca mulatta]